MFSNVNIFILFNSESFKSERELNALILANSEIEAHIRLVTQILDAEWDFYLENMSELNRVSAEPLILAKSSSGLH